MASKRASQRKDVYAFLEGSRGSKRIRVSKDSKHSRSHSRECISFCWYTEGTKGYGRWGERATQQRIAFII